MNIRQSHLGVERRLVGFGRRSASHLIQIPSYAQRDPDLGHDGVWIAAKEGFDLQVLLDPLEEQLDLLALTVDFGNGLRRQMNDIDQKHIVLARLGVSITSLKKTFWVCESCDALFGRINVHVPRIGKAPLALAIMAGVVIIVALGWIPISCAALGGAALILFGQRLGPCEEVSAHDPRLSDRARRLGRNPR